MGEEEKPENERPGSEWWAVGYSSGMDCFAESERLNLGLELPGSMYIYIYLCVGK